MAEESQWRKSKSSGLSQGNCHSFSREITAFDIQIAAQLQKSWIPAPWRDQLLQLGHHMVIFANSPLVPSSIHFSAHCNTSTYSQIFSLGANTLLFLSFSAPQKGHCQHSKIPCKISTQLTQPFAKTSPFPPTNLIFILIPHDKKSSFPNYNT